MGRLLSERKALFLHIPKTGGNWVRTALYLMGIEHHETKKKIPSSQSHAIPSHIDEDWNFSFAFVRHPVAWYESYWKFQAGVWKRFELGVWHPHRCIDECSSDDFNLFVENCLREQPSYVSRMYEWYLGPPNQTSVNFIGRTENLIEDFRRLLVLLDYADMKIPNVSPVNVSESRMGKPVWDPLLKSKVMISERASIERFYPGEL